MRKVVWLQTPTVFCLGGGIICFSHWMYIGIITLRRQKYEVVQIWPGLFVCKQVTVCPGHIWTTLYIQQIHKRLSPVLLRLRWILKSLNSTNNQVLIKFQQNRLKKKTIKFAVRSINLLILSRIRGNFLSSGRSQSLYLFIRRVIKQIVVIIESYHFSQLHTEFFPTSFCQG
jgi:hypothetical protein